MPTSIWYLNTTMLIRLEGLVDQDGDAVTSATVELTACTNSDGVTPDGLTLPLELAQVSGGDYQAELGDDIDLTENDRLEATIEITAPGGTVRTEYETIVVRKSRG